MSCLVMDLDIDEKIQWWVNLMNLVVRLQI
jgi:hypothetical protein